MFVIIIKKMEDCSLEDQLTQAYQRYLQIRLKYVLSTKESQSNLAHPSNHAHLIEACILVTEIIGERKEKGGVNDPVDKTEVMLKTEDVVLRQIIDTHWVDIWSIVFPLSQNSGHSPMILEDLGSIDCETPKTKESDSEENICYLPSNQVREIIDYLQCRSKVLKSNDL